MSALLEFGVEKDSNCRTLCEKLSVNRIVFKMSGKVLENHWPQSLDLVRIPSNIQDGAFCQKS